MRRTNMPNLSYIYDSQNINGSQETILDSIIVFRISILANIYGQKVPGLILFMFIQLYPLQSISSHTSPNSAFNTEGTKKMQFPKCYIVHPAIFVLSPRSSSLERRLSLMN